VRSVVFVISLCMCASALAKKAKHEAAHETTAPRPAKPPVDAGPPEILLTFDDGPALDKTPKVLDILDQHHLKAVFFVNGWHFQGDKPPAEKARELLREEVKRGHAVGNHTIHHYFLCGKVYVKRAPEEIEGNAALIEQAIGVRPDLFRTPYGSHCKQLNEILAGLGIKPIGWDIDPQDWRLKDAKKIESYVENQLKHLESGRKIVLFHDVQAATVEALPHILDWLDKENATRVAAGRPPITVVDYMYLLPEHKLVPPLLDALGRVLIRWFGVAATGPTRFWGSLALHAGQV
jgi:peptidoglycan/xylan/chitin deacetylase (PgdA/CDA1 family)